MSLLLFPLALAGSTLGVLVHKILPGWLTVTLLCVVLVFLTWRTWKKGVQIFREERVSARAYAASVKSELVCPSFAVRRDLTGLLSIQAKSSV